MCFKQLSSFYFQNLLRLGTESFPSPEGETTRFQQTIGSIPQPIPESKIHSINQATVQQMKIQNAHARMACLRNRNQQLELSIPSTLRLSASVIDKLLALIIHSTLPPYPHPTHLVG